MAVVADTRTVTIQLSQLTEHLGCVLCRGMLRDAQTIPECLHSFCKSCIYRYFLVQCDPNEPTCPKCKMALTARPIATLISDQKLQDVVDKIFPEHRERDDELETQFYERHNFKKKKVGDDGSSYVAEMLATSALEFVKPPQALATASPAALSTTTVTASSSAVATVQVNGATDITAAAAAATAAVTAAATATAKALTQTASAAASSASSSTKRTLKYSQLPLSHWSTTILQLFTIEVYPEECGALELPKLQRPYLHVDGRFKMFELRKYITKTLQLEKLADELEMTCLGVIVGPELSVHFIHRTIWQHKHEGRTLVLRYRHLAS